MYFFHDEHRIQSRDADAPLRKKLFRHPKKGSLNNDRKLNSNDG
jgi:hypothetical protein